MAQRQANPAEESNVERLEERRRIPAGAPTLRLAVPEIPGWHLHWFTGKNVPKALDGWYQFVDKSEVQLTQISLGSDLSDEANTDLGNRVSRAAGGFDESGQPERLYLMKIEEKYWLEDQAALVAPGSRIDNIRRAVLQGQVGMEKSDTDDRSKVYVGQRSQIPDMFKPKSDGGR